MAEADKEFVENVVKAIVDHPDDVKTKRSVDEMGVLIELSVHPEDMGKIIGKEGRTAKSIRTLLRVLGAKNNARVNLKIIEPEGGREVKVPETEEKDEKTSKLEEGQVTEVV
ncbi:MAG: KH domain-containing protein [Patescibacteria group bacterium]|nr:KH domain-containing protein [Patescibacteria group bacterium]